MQFTNINIFTIIIFIILSGIIVFLAYKKYFSQINFNKKYKLLASPNNFYVKYIFLIISLLILFFGIFGIKYSGNNPQVENEGIDIMFVLDVSKSMNVADISDSNYAYTRLDIAKKAISDYVVKNENNRFGLVIFAGDAISTIPLTTDTDLFLTMLSGVDYRNLTVQGSDFSKALDLGLSRFIGDKDRSKALVFISDGGDDGDNLNISGKSQKDIAYFIVGIGTEDGGKIIKGRDGFNRISYQKYKGQYVISKLNLDNLDTIASKLNTDVFELKTASDLKKIDSKIKKLEKKAITKKSGESLNSYSRNITIFSLIFFILFLVFYIFPNKLEKLGKKY